MLITRGMNILRGTYRYHRLKNGATNLKLIRSHGTATYRSYGDPPLYALITSEALGAFAWWWMIWHLWHDYEHITGEYPYPDPSKWTDEELGIPPDDE